MKEKSLSKMTNIKAGDVFIGKKFFGSYLFNPKKPALSGHVFSKSEIIKARDRYVKLKKKNLLFKVI